MSLLKKMLKNEREEIHLFNLFIDIENWDYPSKILGETRDVREWMNQSNLYRGYFSVTSSGELLRDFKENLHTLKGTVDESEISVFARHIHFEKGGIQDLLIKNGKVFFKSFYEASMDEREKITPRYTLKGLYATLPDQKIETKIIILNRELKNKRNFDGDIFLEKSLSPIKTKLKLLENKYKKMISNQ